MAVEEEELDKRAEEDLSRQGKGAGLPVKMIALIVLLLCASAGGYFLWKAGVLANFMGKETLAGVPANSKPDIGPIYPLDTFIVNLVDPLGKRYLKVKLNLELDSEKLGQEIEKRLPQIKDTVLTLLSSKSYDDINTLEGKLQLRAEIISMLNQYLKSGMITNLYFTEFIVQ